MGLQLRFHTVNSAFADDPEGETARILRGLADIIERGARSSNVYDSNGNKVGAFWLELPRPIHPRGPFLTSRKVTEDLSDDGHTRHPA